MQAALELPLFTKIAECYQPYTHVNNTVYLKQHLCILALTTTMIHLTMYKHLNA